MNLKQLLNEKKCIRMIETVNGLEALIVESIYENEESFDGLWLSGLCHAAWKGLPDDESMPFEYKLEALRDIRRVSQKPILVDCDTGGDADGLCRHIEEMKGLADAAVIEDKKGIKKNSLYGNSVSHEMESIDIFTEKIRKAVKSADNSDMLIFARIESFISGEAMAAALKRAESYIDGGAAGIVIHSAASDGNDVFAFADEFHSRFHGIPLIMIPTMYNKFSYHELEKAGANIVIYANQLTRSACLAMEKTARSILHTDSSSFADENCCVTPKKLLAMIEGEKNDKCK